MRLVNDDRIVFEQVGVGLRFGEQHAVGHDLDASLRCGLVAEADFAADVAAVRYLEFLGDALSDREGGDAARLCDADARVFATAGFKADLGQLGAFARARFAGDDDDGVFCDGCENFVLALADRQSSRIGGNGAIYAALFAQGARFASLT